MRTFVADFETTTHEKEKTRIWAFGLTEVGDTEFFVSGHTMEHFMKFCQQQQNSTIYFHNLKFDGQFIIHWLLSNGYTHSDEKGDMTFNVIISKLNQFYSIEVIFKKIGNRNYKKVRFLDSLKKLPFKVSELGEKFGLSLDKLDIDYNKPRPVGYIPTREEIAYIRRDVEIVAKSLELQYAQGLTKMTMGSDALNSYKESIGKKVFDRLFPVMNYEIDRDIRQCYRGGFTYCNPKYKGVDVGAGRVYDVNSLYPYVMYDKLLPFGYPVKFEGKYEDDIFHPLYMQGLLCEFELKKGHIPTIQLKGNLAFVPTDYVESSNFEPQHLFLTNVDLKLFFEHYDVIVYEWRGGLKFRGADGMFQEYIDYWMEIKENSTGATRENAKLMLNNLYGKFGSNPDVTGKYPVLKDGIVEYSVKDEEIKAPVYTPIACFVTSYARDLTIRSAQKHYDRFIYADTDSLHLEGLEIPSLNIHDTKLGWWKDEGTFSQARFIRSKTYMEHITNKKGTGWAIACAGMPENVKELVTWDNFKRVNYDMLMPCRDGHYYGKLMPKRVEGGVILEPTEFTIY